MKHHLLLCYLQYLSFYVLLKLNGHFVSNHPVVERLIEIKLLLSKLKPIEDKLDVQVSDLLSRQPPAVDSNSRSSGNSSRDRRAPSETVAKSAKGASYDSGAFADDDYDNAYGCSSSYAVLKPRPELLVPIQEEGDGGDSDGTVGDAEGVDGAAEEGLSGAEGAEEGLSGGGSGGSAEGESRRRKKGVYEAPKLVAVPYSDLKGKVSFSRGVK